MRIFFLMISVDKYLRSRQFIMPQLLVVALLLWGCDSQEQVNKFSGQTMGTYWQVSIASSMNEKSRSTALSTIEQTLTSVNQSMSTYITNSEISLFNQANANEPYKLSAEILTVVDTALAVSKQTDGLYDITIAPLVNLWGFGPEHINDAPDEDQIKKAIDSIGYQALERIDGGLVKHKQGMMIDLSSVAKGYGVDRIASALFELGYDHFLVDIGGEISAYGDKFGQPWRVAIEKPADGRQVQSIIELTGHHTAIASSGNYRNFIDYEGERAVHTIDPQTGYPVSNTLLSATVIADNCMNADAYATALMLLDEDALAFANRHELSAVMIYSDGKNGFNVVHSEQFVRQFGE